MIPLGYITAWSSVAPWSDPRQVEQDLIIARAIVEIFNDDMLRKELRFRGGTALNKLHFPSAIRYSEDIDLVRTTAGPIGPILDRVRAVLEPWLDRATFEQSPVAPALCFRVKAEGSGGQIRLKVEINTSERQAFDGPCLIPFTMQNEWFSGRAEVATFSREEMLATKLRALLQREKGRDLFDLAHSHDVFDGLIHMRAVEHFGSYLIKDNLRISRAQAEERMFAKLNGAGFITDMRPLLASMEAERLTDDAVKVAFVKVYSKFVALIPGDPWARSEEMKERFGITHLFEGGAV